MFSKRIKKSLLSFLLGLVVCSFFLAIPKDVSAQVEDTFGIAPIEETTVLGSQDIRITIAKIIRAVIGLLGIIALVIVIYGGFVYLTSAGNEEKIGNAKKIMINGAIGLAIILSSFAITQFVLNRLAAATGFMGETSVLSPIDPRCSDPNYYNAHLDICGGGDFPNCEDRFFVVKSITPNTSNLQVNNIAVRVIFSKKLADGIDPSDVFEILADGTAPIQAKRYFIDDDRSIVEAVYDSEDFCDPGREETCIPSGSYRVRVNPDIRDVNGNILESEVSCGSYPLSVVFGIESEDGIDRTLPNLEPITINDDRADLFVLQRGKTHAIKTSLSDDNSNSYIRMKIYRENANENSGLTVYAGPAVSNLSSENFEFVYNYAISRGVELLKKYKVDIRGYDSDHNYTDRSATFVIVGEHCDESGRPISENYANECLGSGGDYCDEDDDCASGVCDEQTNQCVDVPVITSLDAWEGASGNFVTIMGKNFGTVNGEIRFVKEQSSILVEYADCGNIRTWTDSYILIKTPNDDVMPNGTEWYLSLKTQLNGESFIETTIDDNGPIGGPRAGYFLKNDQLRPGLCAVKTNVPNPAEAVDFAYPGANILAQGVAFGNEQGNNFIDFGGINSAVQSWNDSQIESSVPTNMNPGRVAVSVWVDGVKSNALPFTVLSTNDDNYPTIISIDPISITPGSYLTINGFGFGENPGNVYLAEQENMYCDDNSCIATNLNLPRDCGDNWQNNLIITKINDRTVAGNYFVSVMNADNISARSAGIEALRVVDGTALPSLCRLSPSFGPAPLPPASEGLKLSGINFGNNPTVFFWWKNSNIEDISNTWLSTDHPGRWLLSRNANSISTLIPINADDYSMQSGPIKVGVRSGDGFIYSNAINYTVEDCRDNPGSPLASTNKCCISGPDAGLWRPLGTACQGEVRSAGYIWRFTSGFMPQMPKVIETCDEQAWQNDNVAIEFPSPTPWERWRSGRSACVNLQIAVRFTLPMNEATFNNNVKLFSCGASEEKNCLDNRVEIRDFNFIFEEKTIRIEPDGGLQPNTWYRVELLEGIESAPQSSVFGVADMKAQPLQKTRACGEGTAYCFDFKTGTDSCILKTVGVNPPFYRSQILGELPFHYYLWGRGNQECSVMPVDGLGWSWYSSKNNLAEIAVKPDETHTDTRARATAKGDSAPYIIEIGANATVRTEFGGMSVFNSYNPTSSLIIELADPEVVEYWPNCASACVNTSIGARFNRHMNVDTYAGNVYLEKCKVEDCQTVVSPPIILDLSSDNQDYFELNAYLLQGLELDADSWYKVTIKGGLDGVLSLGQLLPVKLDGKPLPVDFSWKFRTKKDNVYCQLSQVTISPNPFSAYSIGEKTKYTALAKGSPDDCSPYGQRLNPWNYGWKWKSADELVA